MHRQPAGNDNGFTLIEVIVSLILIGIMGVVVAMGLVAITKGYVFSRQSNETALKAQVAMAKMVKEIGTQSIRTYTITTATPTSIIFNYEDPAVPHTIALSGTEIQFDTITLVNNVASFTFHYYDFASVETTIPADIRRVDIALSLTGAEGILSNLAGSAKIQESYY